MLELRTLGGLSLEAGDRSIEEITRQPKRLALLVTITISAKGRTTRQQLLSLFWPEIDESSGRRALNQALYGLRNALGDGVIENVGRHELRINQSRLTCDAVRFQLLLAQNRFDEAIALYRGPFLDGFYLDRHAEFSRWVDGQRAAFEKLAQGACWSAAEAAEREGDLEGISRWVRRALDIGMIDERMVRRGMEMLHGNGDPLAALDLFAIADRRVREELDLEPSRELYDYATGIRNELTGGPSFDQLPAPTAGTSGPGTSRRLKSIHEPVRWRFPVIAGLVVIAATGLMINLRPTPDPATPMAWSITLPDTAPLALPILVGGSLNISHDGSVIAYVAETGEGTQLYVRKIDSFDAVPVPNTMGARAPFFSPGDDWLGFWTDGELRKTPVAGGPVFSIAPAPQIAHGVWLTSDTIVFSDYLAIQLVSTDGGPVDTISFGGTPSDDSTWTVGYWPSPLPGDTVFLVSRPAAYGDLGLLSLTTRRFTSLGVAVERLGTGQAVRWSTRAMEPCSQCPSILRSRSR